MNEKSKNKERILIVDDSEMNRMILADMLEDQYEILEAADGAQGISILQQMSSQISLVLLDIVMPEMDGFEVLAVMNQKKWIEDVPVIMISAESMPSYVQRAYELGVTDYISRPFDSLVVQRRVINTIMLYAKQRKLIKMVTNQMFEKEKNASLMVTILSHIVEFRNGESGLHVLHIQTITELLLKSLLGKTDKYQLSHEDINMITMASALHDIGKIAIPSEVLNKPGRFTAEEYEVMKTHSAVGASMLKDLPFHQDELLVKVAYQICRWHHERYDGRGYPDGLKGEEIPISAQVVSMADVYDALTSERVYKKAFSHETALQMIQNGECGTFNPLLIECLLDVADSLLEEMKAASLTSKNEKEIRSIVDEILHHEELDDSNSVLQYLEEERMKYQFYASISREIQFEYTVSPSVLTLTEWSAQCLGLDEITMDPLNKEKVLESMSSQDRQNLQELLHNATPEEPDVRFKCKTSVGGKVRAREIVCRSIWSDDEKPQYLGVIGKVLADHDE
ncbi:MAG: response regulator [Ruminococcus sp.]|nr:response regulator [Ruminococcus sp.]